MPIDDLNSNEFAKLIRRIERLERAAPVGYSSVTSGALEISSPEGLIVDGTAKVSGEMDVTGTLNVSGILKGLGSLLWDGIITLTSTFTAKGATRFEGDTTQVGPFHVTGATDINGDATVNGPFHVKGTTDITGTSTTITSPFHIQGATDLTGNLTVNTGGKIVVGGGLSLEPQGAGGGSVNFLPSGSIGASVGDILMVSPDGTTSMVLGHGGLAVGLPNITAVGHAPNVWCDPATGKLYRTS